MVDGIIFLMMARYAGSGDSIDAEKSQEEAQPVRHDASLHFTIENISL